MPMLDQQVSASKRAGGILGIQDTPGSSVKPKTDLHHHEGRVQIVTSLAQLNPLLEKAKHSCAAVFFTSATCPPCKTLYPLYDQLAAEVSDKGILIKVDTSQAIDVGRQYSISATPTFITFLKGQQENRWMGADPSALRGNIQLLVQMAWPPHPHQALRLPTLNNPNAQSVLYTKVPPLPKLLAKMGPAAHDAQVHTIKRFIETRASSGPAEATLPNVDNFAAYVRESLHTLPTDVLFTIVDLLRCALVDPRFSACLAEESEHRTVVAVLEHVNGPTSTCPYALRLVTLQMACNLFSSALFAEQVLRHDQLRAAVTQLVSASFLDEGHSNVRVTAASLMFNVALANSKARSEGPGDGLPEGDQVEMAASVLEAIGQEEASKEALEGMLMALGYLVYRLPLDGELAELLRMMEAGGLVLAKGEVKGFGGLKLLGEVGGELLGKGLKRA